MSAIEELRERIRDARFYIVPYSHSDWAWTYSRQWHEERYTVVFEDVLGIMRRDPDYKWYFDTENEQLAPFRLRRPHLMDELRERVAQGRIAICGGTLTNPHPHRVGGETLIRNLVMGRRYFETEFPGCDLSVLTLNDVIFGHTQLPQIAAKCGYKYYRSTRPACIGERGIPREFLWRSPDGTELLCSWGVYGGPLARTDFMDGPWEDRAAEFMQWAADQLVDDSPTGAIWIPRGADDIRPLRDPFEAPLDVPGFVHRWNENGTSPMQFATPLDYFQDVQAHIEQVPIIEGPVDPVGWSYWYGQIGNESLRTWRLTCEERLLTAEKLAAVCSLKLGDEYPQEQIEQLWHDFLSCCPHATLWLFTEDYDAMLWKLKSACAAADEIVSNRVTRLSSLARTAPERGECGVVFNPELHDRDALVHLHKVCPKRGCRGLEFEDAAGNPVPYQLIEAVPYQNGTIEESDVLVRVAVPAMGYATVSVRETGQGEAIAEGTKGPLSEMESDTVKLRFDEGKLVSLTDKSTGVEHVAPGDYCANDIRLHVIEDTGPYHFGPVIDTVPFTCDAATVTEQGDLCTQARIAGHIGDHAAEQTVTVYSHTSRIDFDLTLECVGGDGFFRVYFPFAYDGSIQVDVPFGVEPRDVTQEPYGTCVERKRENVFYGSHWADYCAGHIGCALIIEPGQQGFCHFPDQRVLGHTFLKTIVHPTEGWERFETRTREGKGRQRFRWALYPHAAGWASGSVDREALDFRTPLRWHWKWAPTHDSQLAGSDSFLSCSSDNVALSSLYREGDTVILRVHETRGAPVNDLALALPFSPVSAAKTDCLLQPLGDAVSLDGNLLGSTLGPWEIATFALGI